MIVALNQGEFSVEIDCQKIYSDASLALDPSTRVAAAARSGLINLHFAFVVDHADLGRINVFMLGVARKLTLRASGGSNTPSSYTQTQRSCQTHLRV